MAKHAPQDDPSLSPADVRDKLMELASRELVQGEHVLQMPWAL